MNLSLKPEDAAFQKEVERFINQHWPREARRLKAADSRPKTEKKYQQDWWNALVQAGWSVPHWPVEFGGTGWTPTQHYIWNRVLAKAECPPANSLGARIVGPLLCTWGTRAQQRRFLPPIREARVQWCQGYSEPSAGSDLAALMTTALRLDDHYLLNGTKAWVAEAQSADWMFCLVRTSAEPKVGMTFLLLDMHSEGVGLEPVVTLGNAHKLSTVTLNNVRVPVDQRIGEEGGGLAYAEQLRDQERLALAEAARLQVEFKRLRQIASKTPSNDTRLDKDPYFRRRMDAVEIELMALEMTELRALSQTERGCASAAESAVLKIRGIEVRQHIAELVTEACGHYAIPYPNPLYLDNEGAIGPEFALSAITSLLRERASSLLGGTSEIQYDSVAEQVLGL